ncbi:MAG: hypothetical protein RL758_1885, partial [Pseudomonadota bacterium]
MSQTLAIHAETTLQLAREALTIEAEAVHAMAQRLDQRFV